MLSEVERRLSRFIKNVRSYTDRLDEAAAEIMPSPGTFKKLIDQGIAPQPIRLGRKGKQIFDRLALDAAMDARGQRVA